MTVALACWVLEMYMRRKRNRRVLDSDDENEEQALRPTAAEKAYAIHIIDTLMKLGLLRGKGQAVPVEHIALAIAIHTGDASVTALPPAEQRALFGIARTSATAMSTCTTRWRLRTALAWSFAVTARSGRYRLDCTVCM